MSKKIKISAFEYDKLSLLVKDYNADLPDNSEMREFYVSLAKKLELKAKELKEREEETVEGFTDKLKKKQWKCDFCGKITKILMVKRCGSCGAYDTVKAV